MTPEGHGQAATIDLREGFRVEVEPMVLPAGEFGARLYRPPTKGKGRWKQVGRMVVAATPEKAVGDLMQTLNLGLMPNVEVAG